MRLGKLGIFGTEDEHELQGLGIGREAKEEAL